MTANLDRARGFRRKVLARSVGMPWPRRSALASPVAELLRQLRGQRIVVLAVLGRFSVIRVEVALKLPGTRLRSLFL